MSVLVTGATGFLGAYVTARLVARGEEVVALVRGEDPQARLDATAGPGAVALPGDLGGPLALPADVTRVIHCAAGVSFTLPLDEARAINVEGTRRLLEACAALPALERFVHVSTAYVEGDESGRFRNTYEQSKAEAERVVGAARFPVSIVRPSIVVGDSTTGWTNSFNVIYAPLQAFARGLFDDVPADPDAVVDVVPVDHVADVIDAALEHGERLLPAVAAEHAVSAEELAALAAAAFDRPPPRFTGAGTIDGLEVYAPYFCVRTRFTAEPTRALGLQPPHPRDYLDTILDFARATRWGRRGGMAGRTPLIS